MIAYSEVSRVHERNDEMRRTVAANRLARQMRAIQGRKLDLARGLTWKFARYGGLLRNSE